LLQGFAEGSKVGVTIVVTRVTSVNGSPSAVLLRSSAISCDDVVHLRDTFQTFWISPTPENTSIASPARVKGVPAKAFSMIPKAPFASRSAI
jgi:hypothetical protein